MFNYNVEETPLFIDDAQIIGEMLKRDWSLGPGKEPTIAYKPESYMMNARYGAIYIYQISRNTQITSSDYRTVQLTSHVGLKISCNFRENHFEICEEIKRILVANRRAGKKRLGGYTYLEINNERFSNDLVGWYTTTIDIKMVSFNTPLRSAGFGDDINRKVACKSEYFKT